MAKAYKVTTEIYNRYKSLVNDERYSKAAACRAVGIAASTMRDHIKRIEKTSSHEYFIIRRSNSIGIAVSDRIFTLEYKSKFYLNNKNFIEDLVGREDYHLTNDELKLIEQSVIDTEISDVVKSFNKDFEIYRGKAYYKKFEISRELFKLIKAAYEKGDSKNRILKFAELMIQNTDKDVVRQLHPFLMHNDIEICDNGYILAYKSVRTNFKDHYSGKFDNSVGKYVEMNRDEVDNNPNKTCSNGLHVGSLSYIKSMYSNDVVVKCIIHPKDFVSIPTDYNGAKARVCRYKVVGILDK